MRDKILIGPLVTQEFMKTVQYAGPFIVYSECLDRMLPLNVLETENTMHNIFFNFRGYMNSIIL